MRSMSMQQLRPAQSSTLRSDRARLKTIGLHARIPETRFHFKTEVLRFGRVESLASVLRAELA